MSHLFTNTSVHAPNNAVKQGDVQLLLKVEQFRCLLSQVGHPQFVSWLFTLQSYQCEE